MKPSSLLARRYLFSRKKKSVINVISWISLVGIAVGTCALIVVLGVYNGIGQLTQDLFSVFDPQLLVEPAEGKTFLTSTIDYDALQHTPGVERISQIVEENAWLTHKHNEAIVQLRGVDSNYAAITGLDTLLHEGAYYLKDDRPLAPEQRRPMYLLFGGEVWYNLGLGSYSNSSVAVHIPRRGTSLGMTMENAFNTDIAFPAGYFYIQQDIDERYVIADIDFVRSLMDYEEDEVTALAIRCSNPRQVNRVRSLLKEQLGEDFTIKDRFEQQPLYFKVFKSERLGVFLILSLIVLIATLNLIASLSLLIIDKRKDIGTLKAMGMNTQDVRRTFLKEGILIALVGVVSGLVFGFLICFLQQQFGIVKMGSNFITDSFPVAMRLIDFVATFVMVTLLSTLAIAFTVKKAKI